MTDRPGSSSAERVPFPSWDNSLPADQWLMPIESRTAAELVRRVAQLSECPLWSITGDDASHVRLTEIAARAHESLWSATGPGFAVIDGLPVSGMSETDAERLALIVARHFGVPVSQSDQRDLIGHVRHEPTASVHRGYKSNRKQEMHTDLTPLAGLLCRRRAKRGGASLVVSAAAVHNQMLEHCPDLLEVCYHPFPMGRLGEQRQDEKQFDEYPVFASVADELGVLYGRALIMQSQECVLAPRLTADQLQAMDAFEQIAHDPHLTLVHDLQPGQLLLVANHRVLHARTAYEDFDEPTARRHLLRFWLEPRSSVRTIPSAVRFDYRFGAIGLRPEKLGSA